MKKTLSLVAAFFLTLSAFSQEQRFLEVSTVDTITLKATKIVCEVSSGKNIYDFDYGDMDSYDGDEDTYEKKEKKKTITNEDITKILDQNKFKYTVQNPELTSAVYDKKQVSILVDLKSESDINKLTAALEKLEDVDVKISDVFYESPAMHLEKSYTNLYNKALTQANMLAKISGNTVGKLISASDVKNSLFDYEDMNKQLLKSMPKGFLGSTGEIQEKQQIQKMIFKFELK